MEAKPNTLLEELCASPPLTDYSPLESIPPTNGAFMPNQAPVDVIDVCWVARAVYGADNPQWMQFRAWLLADAPAWFRELYIHHGQRVARWITPHQRVKSVIRRWMDSVVASR